MSRATLRQLVWIICIISSVKVKARRSVTVEEKSGPLVNPSYDLCEQIQCLRVEDIFTKTVDLYENPCNDYYNYACRRNYTGSVDHKALSSDPNQVFDELKNILELAIKRPLDEGNEALSIEKSIFKLCENGGVFSHVENEYYRNTILPRSGANRLLSTYDYLSDTSRHWDEVDLRYALKGFGFAFFEVEIYEHTAAKGPYDGFTPAHGRYILIKPPSYNIMQLSYLLNQYFNNKRGRDYSHGSTHKYDKLNQFISTLSTAVSTAQSRVGQETSDVTFKRISQWQADYGSHVYNENAKIDWLNYLSKLFATVGQRLYDSTHIAIQSQGYFLELAAILQATKDINPIVNYVHLHFVSKSIGLTDPDYREYSILPQFKELPCTPGLLVGTAYSYADEYFPEDNRQLLVDMITKVKDTVISRVSALNVPAEKMQLVNDFIDEYKNAQIFAGYPDWLMNGTTAYSIYGNARITSFDNFYTRQTNLIEHLLRVKLLPLTTPNMPIIDPSEIRKGFESNEIVIDKKKIDGSLDKTREIVIPFGYFNEMDYRFFSSQLFDPVNYGAVATEVAFKLYSNLLTRITYPAIAPRCIRDRVPINITDTKAFISKGVAYLLALEAAHESWPSKNSYPIQFVDFGAMTDSDLFFLSFAKSLCSIPPKNHRMGYEDLETNPYRINEYSALHEYMNFALENFEPFSENYVCEKNHKMYRERKCDPFDFYSPEINPNKY